MCLALDEMCQDAREEGLRTGITNGILKRNKEIVIKLLQKGMSDEWIQDITDVSLEELTAIKSQMM